MNDGNIFINIETYIYEIYCCFRIICLSSCEHVMICILCILLHGRDFKTLQQITVLKSYLLGSSKIIVAI